MVFPYIKEVCDKFVNNIQENKRDVDAIHLCSKYTLSVTASCGFGVDAETLTKEKSVFAEMLLSIYSGQSLMKTTAAIFIPWLSSYLKIPYIPTKVDTWMRSMINEILVRREQKEENRNDLLQSILETREKKGGITDNMITGYCLSFLLEGFETSSSLMGYVLFELGSRPEILKKCQEEIDRVLEKYNGELTYDALQDMNYLEAVCYETSRMYPAMLALCKICTKPFELPPQYPDSTKRVLIQPGTQIILPVTSIHGDPAYYTNPDEYDPDRFLGDKQHNKFAFLSFGEGTRICIGMKFAFVQTKAGMASILSNFNVRRSAKQVVPLVKGTASFLLTCENGIWIDFENRKNKLNKL